jgi:hypothetical protein
MLKGKRIQTYSFIKANKFKLDGKESSVYYTWFSVGHINILNSLFVVKIHHPFGEPSPIIHGIRK